MSLNRRVGDNAPYSDILCASSVIWKCVSTRPFALKIPCFVARLNP
jgi:hypothetical protein